MTVRCREAYWERTTWKLQLVIACILSGVVGCASAAKSKPPATPPTSAAVGNNTTIVAIAPAPAASNCSLPQFLGLPGLAKGTGGILQRIGSRLLTGLDLTGRFPGLQPQPPVLPLTDPANMEPGAPPAVQAAADIKAEEDAAPQKIMAIRYLATLGCGGCYEKVEDALLEAMSDCTEAVRYEAVRALQCKPECGCKFCSSPSCCSMKVRKRLQELTTCEKEPSARIRRVARMALACCNSKPLQEEDVPREGPPSNASGELAANGSTRSTSLFDGISLVSFETSTVHPTADMVLADVNGEPIYESQVLPLVESRLRDEERSIVNANDPIVRRKQLAIELTRVIDWKLISQQVRSEVQFAGTNQPQSVYGPQEIQSWFERRVPIDTNISSQELSAYYEVHRNRFRTPMRVRWEHITVHIEECSNRESATAIATYLRNRVLGLEVVPPSELSRDKMLLQTNGWTDVATVEPVLFRPSLKQLQAGQISQIIETPDELHLIRVLERQDEGYVPLPTVAEPIRNDILNDRRRAAELRLIAQLRSQSRIWTVFDTPVRPNGTMNGTGNRIAAPIPPQSPQATILR